MPLEPQPDIIGFQDCPLADFPAFDNRIVAVLIVDRQVRANLNAQVGIRREVIAVQVYIAGLPPTNQIPANLAASSAFTASPK